MDTFIDLPAPRQKGPLSLEEALAGRRSVRRFSDEPLSLDQLGQLLWAAQGITSPRKFRTAPSAGATYSLRCFCLTRDGVYEYVPEKHAVRQRREGDYRPVLQRASLNQTWVGNAPLDIVITARYGRTTARYGQRGQKYVHMEAGHAAQNVHLQAVALGLASVPVGAFSDETVAQVLDLPIGEKPLYIIPVGHPD